MAKEALDQILQAESQASALLADARRVAAERMEAADDEARKAVNAIFEEAKQAMDKIAAEARERGEKEAQPLLVQAEREASRYRNLSPEALESAVNYVVTTVLNYGNR